MRPTEMDRAAAVAHSATLPEVFIIESLRVREEGNHREGEIIAAALRMAGKMPAYHYVRTRRELEYFLRVFAESRYRYLHLSMHGNLDAFFTTFDEMNDEAFSTLVAPVLDHRRLFLSACLATTDRFAGMVFRKGGCRSIAGPVGSMGFSDSSVFWTAFYHLMFKQRSTGMSSDDIKTTITKAAFVVDERIQLFLPDDDRAPMKSVLPRKGFGRNLR